MATVAQVLRASLNRILVGASEAPIEPDEAQDFVFALNNYMLGLDAQGIKLGYTEVASTGDDVTVPTGALRGIIANMAIEVAPDYGAPVPPALAAVAVEGMVAMRRLGQRLRLTQYPSTLPIGSGNEGSLQFGDDHFFPDLEADILSETTGAIGLETNTNDATISGN